jgi:hypothetical protein
MTYTLDGQDGQPCQLIHQTTVTQVSELDLCLEEADVRLIPHALHATTAGTKRICLLSNDTDVLVVALHHWNVLHCHGLGELWMRAGIGDSTRYIPLHTLGARIGSLCGVLPAVHTLTGCDTTSKFGTKAAALKAEPVTFLQGFGANPNDPCLEQILQKAEEYLVQVLKRGSPCKTTDELRYQMYHQSKAVTMDQLPPTSASTTGHIRRSFYAAYTQMNCLTGASLDPKLYGFTETDGLLMPCPCTQMIPDNLALTCNCQKCATKRCDCRRRGVPCCVFCKCQSESSQCKNPHIVLRVPLQT